MIIQKIRYTILAASLVFAGNATAVPAQAPLFLVKSATPMVMFAMSVDHQLFAKAFADYSDLNGDGVIDTSYTDTFDYFGYFASDRCYAYNTSSGIFEPKDAATGANRHHCAGSAANGDWSGNFLNWATMTRIDVLRKALYGGKRAIDTSSRTVLERALLANDVHAYAKVFTPTGTDSTANYTPYNVATLTLCNSTPEPTSGSDETQSMSTVTNPPKVRVANGDWSRWAAGEKNQCEWSEDQKATTANNDAGTVPAYAQNLFSSGTRAAPNVKVDVCVSGKLEDNCATYNSTDFKPTGLFQEYGEDGTLRFGLVSGSYEKRDHGGVLRKTMGLFAGNATASDDEVNLTDGTFNTGVNGIIATMNKVRLNTWDYSDTQYDDCDTYAISVNEYLTSTAANRKCSNWGNPVSELYLEAVRYLIGEGSATPAFDVSTDALGLPTATWDDPMSTTEFCAPMNVVVVSSGDNNFDTDDLGTVPTVLGSISTATNAVGAQEVIQGTIGSSVFVGEVGGTPAPNPDSNICSAKTFTSLSEMRGLCPTSPNKQGGFAIAGIAHKAHVTDLRSNRTDDQKINTFAIAMAKTLPDFVVPLGNGAMTLVPIAYAGPVNATPVVNSANWAAASLAHLNIEEQVYDVSGDLTYVRFLAQWEDSQWGSDYDMDMVSRISICVGAECINHDDDGDGTNDANPGAGVARVTTRFMHAQGGVSMNVGFLVSGTTADGPYAGLIKNHGSGANFSSFDDDPLRDAKEPTPVLVRTFSAGNSTAKNLPLPLALAAKYGSFKDSNSNDLPDVQTEWDEDGDGVPDGFFFADDPSQIGPKLASFLNTIATTTSASAVVANSVSFQSSTRIYQARFDSADWSGQLLAFPVRASDAAILTEDWDAATLISAQDHDTGREIHTWDPVAGTGVPFRWSDLDASQQALLHINPSSNTADSQGSARLDYLRGDQSAEIANSGTFRDRASLLGDNVNSSPAVVGAPDYGYLDTMESAAYSTFVASYDDADCFLPNSTTLRSMASLEREPIVYFGANDGMLHGVSACTGKERIAYVPNAVMANLPKLTSPNYSHQYYVDGSPTVVDAFWSGAWHTVLVGTTRAGGKAVFALDVTDPTTFDEANAGARVLWEKSDLDTGFGDLGYTFSQPAIVKAEGHGWVSIFGNGYDSVSGKAVLYIVDIDDGDLQTAIELDAGPNNGLSTVAPVDTDNDGLVDLIYAGDLKGNLWRLKASSGGFASNRASLLYAAKNASGAVQPITTRPEVGLHPSSAEGRLVYFGTGKYYETVDGDPANAVRYNTVYGIWDRDTGSPIPSVTTRNSNTLQQQTVTTQTNATFAPNTFDIRVVSDNPIQWVAKQNNNSWNSCSSTGSCGWYLDMTNNNVQGEKIVANPLLRGGRLIFVTTIPSLASCDSGGDSWLMEIDAATGGRINQAVFDLNGDGVFDYSDMQATTANSSTTYTPISGKKSKVGILQPPAIVAGVGGSGTGEFGRAEAKYSSGSKGGQIETTVEDGGLPSQGRKSWLQYQ